MMRAIPLSIPGAYEIETDILRDDRGCFTRTLDLAFLAAHGLRYQFEQESLSWNAARGTLRGLHFQAHPAWETKIVTCVRGRIFDVVVDLRAESPTFGRWDSRELDASRCNSVYVPEGCAHGFQTLEESVAVLYRITPPYCSELARGVNPFDEELGVRWPISDAIFSERDRALPALRNALT